MRGSRTGHLPSRCRHVPLPPTRCLFVRPQPRGTQVSVGFGYLHRLPKALHFFPGFCPPGSLLPCCRRKCVFRGTRAGGNSPCTGGFGVGSPVTAIRSCMEHDGAHKCQTGRDSLGEKLEVFSPLREGSSPQKMAKGLLPGPGQGKEAAPCCTNTLSSILSHSPLGLLSPARNALLCALGRALPGAGCLPTEQPQEPSPAPSSVPQPPSDYPHGTRQGDREISGAWAGRHRARGTSSGKETGKRGPLASSLPVYQPGRSITLATVFSNR